MSTFTGTLERVDLGAGGWALVTDDGRYTLAGDVPDGLEGRRVQVRGRRSGAQGFLMTGDPVLQVQAIEAAD